MGFGVGIAGFFRTGHWVSADEAVFQTESSRFLMDVCFRTSHICQNSSLFQNGFQLF